jgi:hypothetical protein
MTQRKKRKASTVSVSFDNLHKNTIEFLSSIASVTGSFNFYFHSAWRLQIFWYLLAGSSLVNFVVFSTTKTYYPGQTFISCGFYFFMNMRIINFCLFLVVFILMLEFGLSIIMFAFVMTALFSKAKVGQINFFANYLSNILYVHCSKILFF